MYDLLPNEFRANDHPLFHPYAVVDLPANMDVRRSPSLVRQFIMKSRRDLMALFQRVSDRPFIPLAFCGAVNSSFDIFYRCYLLEKSVIRFHFLWPNACCGFRPTDPYLLWPIFLFYQEELDSILLIGKRRAVVPVRVRRGVVRVDSEETISHVVVHIAAEHHATQKRGRNPDRIRCFNSQMTPPIFPKFFRGGCFAPPKTPLKGLVVGKRRAEVPVRVRRGVVSGDSEETISHAVDHSAAEHHATQTGRRPDRVAVERRG